LGKEVNYADLERSVPVDPQRGTSLQDLVEGAGKSAVELEVRNLNPKDLRLLEPPYVAHLENPDKGDAGHYVTVYFHEGDTCWLIDGTSGLERGMTFEDLQAVSSGYVVVPRRGFYFPLGLLPPAFLLLAIAVLLLYSIAVVRALIARHLAKTSGAERLISKRP